MGEDMKKIFLAIIIALFAGTAFGQTELPRIEQVQIGINDAFIPDGFDSSMDAYVVANGIFPNGCYSWAHAEVEHDGFHHKVKTFANVSQGMCLMVMIPFSEPVYLGNLAPGDHLIRFYNGDGTYLEKRLAVEEEE